MNNNIDLQNWIKSTDTKVPVYYGSGDSVSHPHIVCYQNRYEIVATYYPNGHYYGCDHVSKIIYK